MTSNLDSFLSRYRNVIFVLACFLAAAARFMLSNVYRSSFLEPSYNKRYAPFDRRQHRKASAVTSSGSCCCCRSIHAEQRLSYKFSRAFLQ
jgi:hypothetical protein